MSEADSNSKNCKVTLEAQWTNLPQDLLSRIAGGLGLIDFLRFRVVCKDWHNASFKSSAQVKYSEKDLWFLLYGEGSKCSLVSNKYKIYPINIPELDGATCIASYGGWLLLFRQGSIFFFCPFSRAKIELPNYPFTELSDHIAAFSSIPTSQDCIVALISRISDQELELHMLRRGDNQWTKHHFSCDKGSLDTIKGAVFCEGEFHILDRLRGLVTFCADKVEWNISKIVIDKSVTDVLNYALRKDTSELKNMKRKLGLEANSSISSCGTLTSDDTGKFDIVILRARIEAATVSKSRHLKGVWIEPRYSQIPPQLSW